MVFEDDNDVHSLVSLATTSKSLTSAALATLYRFPFPRPASVSLVCADKFCAALETNPALGTYVVNLSTMSAVLSNPAWQARSAKDKLIWAEKVVSHCPRLVKVSFVIGNAQQTKRFCEAIPRLRELHSVSVEPLVKGVDIDALAWRTWTYNLVLSQAKIADLAFQNFVPEGELLDVLYSAFLPSLSPSSSSSSKKSEATAKDFVDDNFRIRLSREAVSPNLPHKFTLHVPFFRDSTFRAHLTSSLTSFARQSGSFITNLSIDVSPSFSESRWESAREFYEADAGPELPPTFFSAFPRLTHLTCRSQGHMSLEKLKLLAQSSPNLRVIDLRNSCWNRESFLFSNPSLPSSSSAPLVENLEAFQREVVSFVLRSLPELTLLDIGFFPLDVDASGSKPTLSLELECKKVGVDFRFECTEAARPEHFLRQRTRPAPVPAPAPAAPLPAFPSRPSFLDEDTLKYQQPPPSPPLPLIHLFYPSTVAGDSTEDDVDGDGAASPAASDPEDYWTEAEAASPVPLSLQEALAETARLGMTREGALEEEEVDEGYETDGVEAELVRMVDEGASTGGVEDE
ncbi:hypothetical protein JCM10213v2_006922 [Rhodosporidiobolus nylandii]